MKTLTREEAIEIINASDPTGETDAAARYAHLSDGDVIEEAIAISEAKQMPARYELVEAIEELMGDRLKDADEFSYTELMKTLEMERKRAEEEK